MFPYYGSKHRAAPKYPAPLTETIVEPFAGSATYSLLYPHKQVWINDLNPRVASVWRYLVSASKDEILSIPLVKTQEETLSLPEEQRNLVGFWWGKALVEPAARPTGWATEGNARYEVQYWGEKRRQRIADQVDSIRHWKVTEQSYENLPDINATWFIDPPYDNSAGRAYTFSDLNYSQLGQWCQSRQGQAIVCENVGAAWLWFTKLGDFKTARSATSEEAVWTNWSSSTGVYAVDQASSAPELNSIAEEHAAACTDLTTDLG